jgi:solute carrier family 13 (sodium-dependent dicarboxylate transporter), member 2/3/5
MIVLGLLLATAVLSAFMSNTATTAMMMTVILPILARMPETRSARIAVVLAIPIGANIGGMATPIGTPPNAIALAALQKAGIHIPFGTWVMMALAAGPDHAGALLAAADSVVPGQAPRR